MTTIDHDGRYTEEAGNGVAARKSLRRKKSLARIFILARKKSSKSKPSSPLQTNEAAQPLPTTWVSKRPSTETVKIISTKRNTISTSPDEDVLVESDANCRRRSVECSPRDTTTGILKDFSFDKPDLRRYDENRNTDPENDAKESSPWKITQRRRVADRLVQRERSRHGLNSNVSSGGSRGEEESATVHQESASHCGNIVPRRPHTATQSTFPDNIHDMPLPFTTQVSSARQAGDETISYRRSPARENWVPWRASYAREEVRESIRSGLSSGSSLPDSGSTEHSSIFTKMSSVSDMTIDLDEIQIPKHRSMTVDDAIDLYSAGFEDNVDFDHEEINRRSLKIAEAMDDDIGSALLMPPSLVSPESRTSTDSTAIISGDVFRFRNIFPRPPSLTKPSGTHDQYGFRKSSRDVSMAQYDTWHLEYSEMQERRSSKWAAMMKDQGLSIENPARFPEPSTKVQRFVRKGIPPSWRGAAWFYYAGGDQYLYKYPDLYSELVLLARTPKLSQNDKEAIERDLNRTFPDNIHFKPDTPLIPTIETPLLSSLRRVLCAFAVHHPRTGYCQSLNFITGLLLLFLPEEKAFWMLHIITSSYLPGTHEVSLEGANVDLWVLMLALKEAVPNIWDKIGGELQSNTTKLPPITLCTTSWFMSLFIGTLPIESVLRVWDVLFYEGSRTLFRVALAIFKLGENEIKSVSDPMEIFQVVQGLPRKMLGIGALMGVACRRSGVSQGWVEKKRKERKEWYARERAIEKIRKDSRDAGRRESEIREASKEASLLQSTPEEEAPLAVSEPARSRANSGWRSKMGFNRG